MTAHFAKSISCPRCKTPTPWDKNNENRPFCSESCRNKDFISWANEEKVIQGNALYDDVLSDDILDDK